MKWRYIVPVIFVIIIMLSLPAYSMVKEEGEHRSGTDDRVPLELGIVSLLGAGGVYGIIKKKKWFMKKHTFRFEEIDKKFIEDDND